MSGYGLDYLKTPLAPALNAAAEKRALDQIARSGLALPARVSAVVSSGIVQVGFEVDASPASLPPVVVPVSMWQYVRVPVKVGDTGYCVPATVSLGGVTGLGAGVPKLWVRNGNLANLAFLPLGSTVWNAADLTSLVLYDQTLAHSVEVTGSGVVIDGNISADASKLGFYGAGKVSRPNVTGKVASASTVSDLAGAVKSLLNALSAAGVGLLTDSTT